MSATTHFIEIGLLGKSHGLKGEIKVDFTSGDSDLIRDLSLVYLKSPAGEMMPMRIDQVRIAGSPENPSFFVLFDKVIDRNSAESLRGYSLLIPESEAEAWLNDPEEAEWLNYTVSDSADDEFSDRVADVFYTAAHPVIQLAESGLMIPFVDEFVTGIDDENQHITFINLERLRG